MNKYGEAETASDVLAAVNAIWKGRNGDVTNIPHRLNLKTGHLVAAQNPIGLRVPLSGGVQVMLRDAVRTAFNPARQRQRKTYPLSWWLARLQ